MAQQIHTKEQEYLNNIKSNVIKNKDDLKQPTKLVTVIKPRLLALILHAVTKNPKDSQIEFVHYLLELITIILTNSDLRTVLLETELKGLKDVADSVQQQQIPVSTPHIIKYLQYLEIHPQFMSIPKMRLRINRLRLEMEMWYKAKCI